MPLQPGSSPTMHTIAQLAGVSRATVSMALRGHPEISAATREKVQRVAEKLGYRRDPLVAALMAKIRRGKAEDSQGTVIAVVGEHPEWWRRSEILARSYRGILARAKELGYRIEDFKIGGDGLTPERLLGVLTTRGIQGVVLAPVNQPGPSAFLGWEHFAIAAFNRSIVEPNLPSASIYHAHNTILAFDQLTAMGFQRPGFAQNLDISARNRHEYLGAYLGRNRLLAPEKQMSPLLFEREDLFTRRAVEAWLEKEQPDAVACGNAGLYLRLRPLLKPSVFLISLETADLPLDCPGIDERPEAVGAATLDVVVGQLHRNERGLPPIAPILHIPGIWRPSPQAAAAAPRVPAAI